MVHMTVPYRLAHPKPEAAFLLGVSLRKLELMVSAKEIKTVQIGRRRLVPRSEIERLARASA
jgi:excisionase family DNA binding protein